jgi:hypothetical protein
MNTTLFAATTAALLALALPALGSEAHSHAHTPAAQDTQHGRLHLNNGQRWSTDEVLRRNMVEIREALASYRKPIQSRTFMPEDGKALGSTIESRVAAILTDCKLEPQADRNLHLIVAELVQAADTLQGKAGHEPAAGASRALRAVHMYATYFDHPGWSPVL